MKSSTQNSHSTSALANVQVPSSNLHQIGMPQLINSNSASTVNDTTGQSQSSVYQQQVKKRRGSNQSHNRNTYLKQGSSSHQPNTQSSNILPQAQSNISLANQKNRLHQNAASGNSKSEATGKKSKTQQPNKLVELFRQADNSQQQSQPSNNTMNFQHTGVSQSSSTAANSHISSNQFIPKGSLSSSNNQSVLTRTMQMNQGQISSFTIFAGPLTSHGAQVHNIQIKPISANKRRGGGTGPSNLI